MANSAESALHWVIGLKMMIFLIMMSNNYTCLLKEHPVFYQKPKEKVVVFFLCRQDNKSHWQSPDGIKAFTQNFFASHVTIANNCFLRSILDLIRPLIFKLYVFLAKKMHKSFLKNKHFDYRFFTSCHFISSINKIWLFSDKKSKQG